MRTSTVQPEKKRPRQESTPSTRPIYEKRRTTSIFVDRRHQSR